MSNPGVFGLNPGGVQPAAASGGSDGYLTNVEQITPLADLTSSGNILLDANDVGKTFELYSSTEGKTVTLPPGYQIDLGRGYAFLVVPKSFPIKLLNSGTPGNVGILEAFMMPGAVCKATNFSNTTAQGDWRMWGSGLYAGPVPVALPFVTDAGVDIGSVIKVANMCATEKLTQNQSLTRLGILGNGSGDTAYIVGLVPNAGTSVVSYAATLNHTTGAFTWGGANTAFSSANAWTGPLIIGLSATTFMITAWEATNAKQSYRMCSVSGTTVTQGSTILSGSFVGGSNVSSSLYTTIGCFVADSATSVFHLGAGDGTNFFVNHLSLQVGGLVTTQDAGLTTSISTLPATQLGSFSPTALTFDVPGSTINQTMFSRYVMSGTTIAKTIDLQAPSQPGNYSMLWNTDPTKRTYWIGHATSLARFTLNASTPTDFSVAAVTQTPPVESNGGVVTPSTGIHFMSDTEALVGDCRAALTIFNPALSMLARSQVTLTTTSDSSPLHKVASSNLGFITKSAHTIGFNVNPANRRVVLAYSIWDQATGTERKLCLAAYDLPRNYGSPTTATL